MYFFEIDSILLGYQVKVVRSGVGEEAYKRWRLHREEGEVVVVVVVQWFRYRHRNTRSSDKVGKDLRSGEGSISGKHDKDKGVNVQVIVRCRPLSEDEVRLHTPVVVSCNENRKEVCAVQNIANKQIDRTFL
ncbi:UNVERIFIED_CONTAM: Kinesin-like protein KIN-5D [Sesamum angustifolium]|uniref:Kinesin-like protein KIN-5D n=1 Tax=Sesamum angustifolium TaxID=2727405 RepID=A0AAW2QQR4_9LAMI